MAAAAVCIYNGGAWDVGLVCTWGALLAAGGTIGGGKKVSGARDAEAVVGAPVHAHWAGGAGARRADIARQTGEDVAGGYKRL